MMTKRTILLTFAFLFVGMMNLIAIPKVVSIKQSDDFVQITLLNPQNEQFRYRLNEESDWIHSSSSEIYLVKIPSGSHQFVLSGIDHPEEIYSTNLRVSTQKRNVVLILIFITGIVYLLLGRSVFRKVRTKQEQKDLAGNHVFQMTSQRLPLFQIFQGLQLLRKYIQEKDKKQSSRFLSKTSLLMRMLLESGTKTDNSLDKELEITGLQFELRKLASGSSFYFNIEKDPECRCEDLSIPALLLNYIVNSSLSFETKSGIPETVHFIIIEIKTGINELIIRVNDNTPYADTEKSHETENQLKILAEKSKTKSQYKVFYGEPRDGYQMGRSIEIKVFQEHAL
jgi:hypothetical protein